jgi:hypothetical protein
MKQVAFLPDDIKYIISGYYGLKQQIILQDDIINYSINIRELINNIDNEQIRYKLLFWKIINNFYNTNTIKKYKKQKIPQIGFIWGLMNQTERHNFIQYLL